MRRPLILAVAAALPLVAVAGCGGSSSMAEPTKPAPRQAASPPASVRDQAKVVQTGKTVRVSRSDYGRILFDGRGRALYLFTRDAAKSRCHGACASAWPPALTRGRPRASGGARQSLLGTVRRPDGGTQITYAGHPVYYYVGDRKPGQVLCQAALEYGGYWYVVKGDGTAVH